MVPGTPRITIPERFDKILGNTPLGNGIRLYVQRFDAWVSDDTKGLFFFPEYTDHGPKHITSVLFGAEALIREEAWKAVTPEDVAVLTAATLFHDAAMHLSADGFLALIDPKRVGERPLIRSLDTQTWPELFAAYYSEARKWDQRRLHRILGDEKVPHEEEPDLIDSVRRPEEMPNPEVWSTRYRKFLGEFVRRHHARLAHEIALYGYPGHTSDALKLPEELSRLADLAGLVARSHNMHLRDTFEYLQKKYWGRVTCQSAHPVFLMVLLRIADYLEIKSDRVNPVALAIQRLRSPLSLEEQSSHLAVHEVRPDEQDEEAIFVIAKPESARLFLKLQGLLKGLQAELDTSWAVLGEVYSKQGELSCFGITLRRIRSNLDSPSEYLQREEPKYFPIKAAFDTTGADLLKLLVKPLYGDRPAIGVRELLQNALDAVHELRQWAADHGDPKMERIPLPGQQADVLISVDKDEAGDAWLTVQDKGIGMTVEVVRNFFLKAGASYRKSAAWRKEFEHEAGAKILRSGRFGVGALAAFLLGERIEVFTRHVSSPVEEGIYFDASIGDEVVELRRVVLSEVGTTIRIRLQKRMHIHSVLWDWYVLTDPMVERRVLGRTLTQSFRFPNPGELSSGDWAEIPLPDYQCFMWSFDVDVPHFTCNGIVVAEEPRDGFDWGGPSVPFGIPACSVFDPNGQCPLNLARNGLVVNPFGRHLLAEAVRELCCLLLLYGPREPLDVPRFGYPRQRRELGARLWGRFFLDAYIGEHILWPVCFAQDGFSLLSSWGLSEISRPCHLYVFEDLSFARRIEFTGGGLVAVSLTKNLETVFGDNRSYLPSMLQRLVGSLSCNPKVGKTFVRVDLPWCTRNTSFEMQLSEILDTPIIPYDPAERRQKLPRAFARLEKYLKRWEPENLTGWRLDTVRWFRGEPTRE